MKTNSFLKLNATSKDLKKTFLILLLLVSIKSLSQSIEGDAKRKIELGSELQFYPAGQMIMITSNFFLNETWALRLRIGGNFADRKDFSQYNDNEIAKGFGGSLGLVKHIPYWKGDFIFGGTVDAWNMWTKWKDGLKTPNLTSGKTYNLVIQPWVNAGYIYNLSHKVNAGISLGFGREINVITRGKKVGEGWIGSVTLSLNYYLQ